MQHDAQPDYGTGQKTLGVYTVGLILCVILTLMS
jgi:heme/copper-type cytochrome/quinol oxidase subunit 4